ANPALQVGHERSAGSDNRPGRGKPQKLAAVQEHLGAEEIMIRGKRDRWIEIHRDQDLFPGYGTFAVGSFAGTLVDPVHDGVQHTEAWIHDRRGKRQAAVSAVARRRIDFDIGGWNGSVWYVARGWIYR